MTNHAINLMAKAMVAEDGDVHWRDYLPLARVAFITLREHDLACEKPIPAGITRAALASTPSPVTNEGAGR